MATTVVQLSAQLVCIYIPEMIQNTLVVKPQKGKRIVLCQQSGCKIYQLENLRLYCLGQNIHVLQTYSLFGPRVQSSFDSELNTRASSLLQSLWKFEFIMC